MEGSSAECMVSANWHRLISWFAFLILQAASSFLLAATQLLASERAIYDNCGSGLQNDGCRVMRGDVVEFCIAVNGLQVKAAQAQGGHVAQHAGMFPFTFSSQLSGPATLRYYGVGFFSGFSLSPFVVVLLLLLLRLYQSCKQ
jgi:hypothetical protein